MLLTSLTQFYVFVWVRSQPWYAPPSEEGEIGGGKLEARNFENSGLFLVSCFQYILVAAVFSIGPPYRKAMWTNGGFCFLQLMEFDTFYFKMLI